LKLPEVLPPIIDLARFRPYSIYHRTSLLSIPLTCFFLPFLHKAVTAREIVNTVAPSSVLKFTSLSAAFPYFDPMTDWSFGAEERIFSRFCFLNGVPVDESLKFTEKTLKPESPFFYGSKDQRNPYFVGLTMPHFFKDGAVTNTGDRPSLKPSHLNEADYERLVLAKVLRKRPAVDCASIRTLSTVGCLSTSRSLAEPLRASLDFFRNAPAITRTIASTDAEAAASVVINIIDGLTASE
jgi:hypothetical protein